MIQLPTHNRDISEEQFQTARILHDYIVQRAQEFKKPVFEYDSPRDKIFRIIEERVHLHNYIDIINSIKEKEKYFLDNVGKYKINDKMLEDKENLDYNILLKIMNPIYILYYKDNKIDLIELSQDYLLSRRILEN